MRIYNIDRHNTIPHVPESVEFDRGVVVSETETEFNHLTGIQPKVLFRGLVPECVQFVEKNKAVLK